MRLPKAAPPSQEYGQQAASLRSQAIVPMGQAPQPAPPLPQPGPPGPVGPPLPPLGAPTALPNQPLTHGLPVGPGAGPEALTPLGPPTTTADLLQRLAQHPDASPDVAFLASYVAGGRG
jgi:hypothetical protein